MYNHTLFFALLCLTVNTYGNTLLPPSPPVHFSSIVISRHLVKKKKASLNKFLVLVLISITA